MTKYPASLAATPKMAAIVRLIGRARGASLIELMKVSGWQAHTMRAAITKLRHVGLRIESFKDNRGRAYRLLGK
jgi:hypothetical protein